MFLLATLPLASRATMLLPGGRDLIGAGTINEFDCHLIDSLNSKKNESTTIIHLNDRTGSHSQCADYYISI